MQSHTTRPAELATRNAVDRPVGVRARKRSSTSLARPTGAHVRFIPGSVARSGKAVAGIIDAVGAEVVGFAPGDRVASLGEAGNIAEPRLLDSESLIGIPRDVSGQQAAALLPQGLVARVLVKETHAVGGGETVLVHAAAGLLGSLIVSWATSLGATVIATVGSSASTGAALRAGAHHVLVFGEEDVAARVREITGGRGVDVVYDGVGTTTRASSLASLRRGGDLVLYGHATEVPPFQEQDVTVLRPRMADHLRGGSIQQGASDLFLAIRSGVFAGVDVSLFAAEVSTVALAA